MHPLIIDDILPPEQHRRILRFLQSPGWGFDWKSDRAAGGFSFWHKHFAGNINPDHDDPTGRGRQFECHEELGRNARPILEMWQHLQQTTLRTHRLTRCYANGIAYGSDGTLHTDSVTADNFTAVYYPHTEWHPDWGGETVVFNMRRDDIVTAIYPKPNRLVVFPGTVPHVARGVSRNCPMLRITLMFKFALVRNEPEPELCQADPALRRMPD